MYSSDAWKQFWNNKSTEENIFNQIGNSTETFVDFFINLKDIVPYLNLNDDDIVLDAGGGNGMISMALSPYVKEITMFDFSEGMVLKAKENTKHFNNIKVFQDDILAMNNIKKNNYTKVVIGSVFQYLKDYEEVKKVLFNIYSIMNINSKMICTFNPDIRKKSEHIKSYDRLKWEPKKIKKSLEIEENRLWTDLNIIEEIAIELGFRKCYETKINSKIWQSTHMYNFVLEK